MPGAQNGGRRGVDGVDVGAGPGAVEGVGAFRVSQWADHFASRPSIPGLSGDRRRPGRSARSVRPPCARMIGLPYRACCGSTTRPLATVAPSIEGTRSVVDVRLRPDRRRRPHLGHGRFSLAFDVLRRYLIFTGLDVTYVSNVTDIEDKIIRRAAERGVPIDDFTRANEAEWWEMMDRLGVLRPDEAPHATAYVDQMIALIEDLVRRGVGYEATDGVYMSVDAVAGYGLLAHQRLDSLRAGARVELDQAKRSPLDFVLWKKAKAGEPTWPSPFGDGRPGWHTECVVMSLDLLGDDFDLHGGAIDLIFPHHENERAQAVATGHTFVRHWVHNGFVTVGGEKMSKSLDNFTSLADLLEGSDPRAYRLLVLQAHYRSPIEVTRETIAKAEAALARLDEMARRLTPATDDQKMVVPAVVDPTVRSDHAPTPETSTRTHCRGSAIGWTTTSTR